MKKLMLAGALVLIATGAQAQGRPLKGLARTRIAIPSRATSTAAALTFRHTSRPIRTAPSATITAPTAT
jgi:hypothetical protein